MPEMKYPKQNIIISNFDGSTNLSLSKPQNQYFNVVLIEKYQ